MTMMIEMFSAQETKIFGITVFGFVFATVFLYLAISACAKLERRRIRRIRLEQQAKADEKSKWLVSSEEFERLGNECIGRQKMKSFIAETALGEVEVVKEENE
jgi:hypothetical protein